MSDQFKIDPEFQAQIPPHRPKERAQLEANLKENFRSLGKCRDALIVWKEQGLLLDGHIRHAICTEHNIPYEVEEISLPNRAAAVDWIDAQQLGRRNLTDDAYALLIGRRYNRMKKKQGGDRGNQYTVASGQNGHLPKTTAERLAAQHGGSEHTIRRCGQFATAVDVVKAVDPDIEEKVIKGKAPARATIEKAAKVITQEHNTERAEELLNGNGAKSPAQRKTVEVNGQAHPGTNGDGHAAGTAGTHPEANGKAHAHPESNGKVPSHHESHGTAQKAPRSRMSDRTRAVIDALEDGKWRSINQALEFLHERRIDVSEEQLKHLVGNVIRGNTKSENHVFEKVEKNGTMRYRVRKVDPDSLTPVSRLRIKDFLDAVTPLLNEAKHLTNKSEYTISPNAIMYRLALIERLIDELQGEITTK